MQQPNPTENQHMQLGFSRMLYETFGKRRTDYSRAAQNPSSQKATQ